MIYINHQLNELDCLYKEICEMIDRRACYVKKPPIGVKPKWLHEEIRATELVSAMFRYEDAGMSFPPEWEEEYDGLVMSWSHDRRVNFLKNLFSHEETYQN